MNIQRVQFLRESCVAGRKGKGTAVIEFSYDDRFARSPRFFEAPDDDMARARQLYLEWGGARQEGSQRGTTVNRPLPRAE